MTTTATKPLTIELVSEEHPGMFVDPGPGLATMFGYHPTWCIGELTEPGVSVEDHGLWCEGLGGVGGDAHHVDGSPDHVYVDIVEPYVHGVIHSEDRGRTRDQYVRLIFGGDIAEDAWLYLGASAARSLAASLVHAADKLELR